MRIDSSSLTNMTSMDDLRVVVLGCIQSTNSDEMFCGLGLGTQISIRAELNETQMSSSSCVCMYRKRV
jgi:hypothetical protein